MIAITKEMLLEAANKLNLIYWQVLDNSNEIGRQDEEISLENSLAQLSDLLDSLQQYSKPGERIKVSMQSKPLTSTGKTKGTIVRTFFVALTPVSQSIQGAPIQNNSLHKEIEELRIQLLKKELEEKHNKERDALLKRIEALEEDPKENDIEKTIGHINTLLAHPLTQMIVGQFFQTKTTSPAINGVPDTFNEVYQQWLKVDPEALQVMQSIVKLAIEQPQQYNMYKPLLLK